MSTKGTLSMNMTMGGGGGDKICDATFLLNKLWQTFCYCCLLGPSSSGIVLNPDNGQAELTLISLPGESCTMHHN